MGWDEVRKARRHLSREQGTIIKDWGGRIPIALIYPNAYFVGMSNLGIHVLYRLLNSYSKVVCERVFWENDSNPISIESQRPLADFAVLAFSITYELDYFNAVSMLKSSGIPPYAADRDERYPLVIGGGPCIIANPSPLAPFFDCLCIGEAESIVPRMLTVLMEGISSERTELLKALASLPGIYVPALPPASPVVRQWLSKLSDSPVTSAILTPDTELGDLFLIEVERGCNWGCRFCLAGSAFRPMRWHSVDNLMTQARLGLQYRKRLGLVGSAVTDYPEIEELLVNLRQMGAGLSISSLRARPLSTVVLREMAGGGAHTIALAPEAGSERLRRVIKKGITEEDILTAVVKVADSGVDQVKLYFMIGLPSETDEDVQGIIDLTIKCKNILDRHHAGSQLSLNIAPFVPKAGTAFQWLPMAPLSILKQRLSRLKNSLSPKGIKVKIESPAWSEVQCVLARGDAKLAEVLANMEEVSLAGWRRAVAKCQLDIDYYAHQRWGTNKQLPWAAIDLGNKPGHLETKLEEAFS